MISVFLNEKRKYSKTQFQNISFLRAFPLSQTQLTIPMLCHEIKFAKLGQALCKLFTFYFSRHDVYGNRLESRPYSCRTQHRTTDDWRSLPSC